MKKFQFKLQTLLEQRKAKEDRLLGELAELRREEAGELVRLVRLKDELDAARQGMASAHARSAPVEELAQRDEHMKAKRDDVRLQELTLKAVQDRVEAKRRELVTAMKDRKVLEALRDRQEQEYLRECARAEQNTLDEIASVRYAREDKLSA